MLRLPKTLQGITFVAGIMRHQSSLNQNIKMIPSLPLGTPEPSDHLAEFYRLTFIKKVGYCLALLWGDFISLPKICYLALKIGIRRLQIFILRRKHRILLLKYEALLGKSHDLLSENLQIKSELAIRQIGPLFHDLSRASLSDQFIQQFPHGCDLSEQAGNRKISQSPAPTKKTR